MPNPSRFSLLAAVLAASALVSSAALLRADDAAPAEGGTMPEIQLSHILEEQKSLLAEAEKQGDNLDQESTRTQLQSISHEYELLLHEAPKMAAAYADYGYLLRKVGMQKEAVGLMLKANELDPNIPMVKNEIGNYLAETGKPLEAVGYFLAAIKLDPNEPLYHYQLGTLLYEGRDDFIRSGSWTRDSIDKTMFEAFKRAAELAPDRIEFTYRYGESFYSLAHPDWNEALKVWASLEEKAQSPIERQTMRLHAANIMIKMDKNDQAKLLLETVTEPDLQAQKQKLIAQLAENAKK